MFSPCTVKGLLLVLSGEYPEDKWDVIIKVQCGDTMGHTLADVVEVACLTLYDTSKTYNGIRGVLFSKDTGSERQLETSRYRMDENMVLCGTMFLQCVNGSFQEGCRNGFIPFGYNDPDLHFRGTGHIFRVVS